MKFRNLKGVLALVMVAMMLMVSVGALAESTGTYPNVVNPHTITIDNTDQNVDHTYEAYQVFKGNLNASEGVLSDIDWGNGIVSATLLSKVIAANTTNGSLLKGKFDGITTDSTAAQLAKAISDANFASTTGANQEAGAIDELAAIIAESLNATNKVEFGTATKTAEPKSVVYTASVSGDGYYFIKDTTADSALDGGAAGVDTVSKYLLSIIKDITIQAKDTGSQSDKVIVEGTNELNDNDAAIGDPITYKATLDPIPNPTKYNVFKMEMYDTMEAGLTFTGISSITMGNQTLRFGRDYYYYVGETKYDTTEYTAPTDPVGTKGSHTSPTNIKIVFKNAKNLILKGIGDTEVSSVGGTLTVNYTAVLNADATLASDSNDNSEHFEFTNDSNHHYEGEEITSQDPKGVTPTKTVETYTTSIKIYKTDGTNALAGATFTIVSQQFTKTLVTAEQFVEDASGAYWKLLDGSYTTQDPTLEGMNTTQYASTTTKYKLESVTQVVTAPDATTKTYTLTSDANGIIKLEGVKAGIYTITEAIAPDGYNLLNGNTIINIDWNLIHTNEMGYTSPTQEQKNTANGGFSLITTGENATSEGVTMTGTNGAEFGVTIVNQAGATLPSTGGIGTTIFYVAGSIMVLAAAILLITKRRMGNND